MFTSNLEDTEVKGLSLWSLPFEQVVDDFLKQNTAKSYSLFNMRLKLATQEEMLILVDKTEQLWTEAEENPVLPSSQQYILIAKVAQTGLSKTLHPSEAEAFFKLATLTENAIAEYELGKLHNDIELLKKAANANIGDAHLLLGHHFLNENRKLALTHFKLAGDCGCPDGYFQYSKHYSLIDETMDVSIYEEEAANQGHFEALCNRAFSADSSNLAKVLFKYIEGPNHFQSEQLEWYALIDKIVSVAKDDNVTKRARPIYLSCVKYLHHQYLEKDRKENSSLVLVDSVIKTLSPSFFKNLSTHLRATNTEDSIYIYHCMMARYYMRQETNKLYAPFKPKDNISIPVEILITNSSDLKLSDRGPEDTKKMLSEHLLHTSRMNRLRERKFENKIHFCQLLNSLYKKPREFITLCMQHSKQDIDETMSAIEEHYKFFLTVLVIHFKDLFPDICTFDHELANDVVSTQDKPIYYKANEFLNEEIITLPVFIEFANNHRVLLQDLFSKFDTSEKVIKWTDLGVQATGHFSYTFSEFESLFKNKLEAANQFPSLNTVTHAIMERIFELIREKILNDILNDLILNGFPRPILNKVLSYVFSRDFSSEIYETANSFFSLFKPSHQSKEDAGDAKSEDVLRCLM